MASSDVQVNPSEEETTNTVTITKLSPTKIPGPVRLTENGTYIQVSNRKYLSTISHQSIAMKSTSMGSIISGCLKNKHKILRVSNSSPQFELAACMGKKELDLESAGIRTLENLHRAVAEMEVEVKLDDQMQNKLEQSTNISMEESLLEQPTKQSSSADLLNQTPEEQTLHELDRTVARMEEDLKLQDGSLETHTVEEAGILGESKQATENETEQMVDTEVELHQEIKPQTSCFVLMTQTKSEAELNKTFEEETLQDLNPRDISNESITQTKIEAEIMVPSDVDSQQWIESQTSLFKAILPTENKDEIVESDVSSQHGNKPQTKSFNATIPTEADIKLDSMEDSVQESCASPQAGLMPQTSFIDITIPTEAAINVEPKEGSLEDSEVSSEQGIEPQTSQPTIPTEADIIESEESLEESDVSSEQGTKSQVESEDDSLEKSDEIPKEEIKLQTSFFKTTMPAEAEVEIESEEESLEESDETPYQGIEPQTSFFKVPISTEAELDSEEESLEASSSSKRISHVFSNVTTFNCTHRNPGERKCVPLEHLFDPEHNMELLNELLRCNENYTDAIYSHETIPNAPEILDLTVDQGTSPYIDGTSKHFCFLRILLKKFGYPLLFCGVTFGVICIFKKL